MELVVGMRARRVEGGHEGGASWSRWACSLNCSRSRARVPAYQVEEASKVWLDTFDGEAKSADDFLCTIGMFAQDPYVLAPDLYTLAPDPYKLAPTPHMLAPDPRVLAPGPRMLAPGCCRWIHDARTAHADLQAAAMSTRHVP